MTQERVLLGVVGRPHGVRGLVHVHSYTAEPEALSAYGPLLGGDGRAWSLAWRQAGVAELRDATGRAVADRSEAERLTNLQLFVPRERLPPPEDDEFYLADLVGMAAVTQGGAPIGSVCDVHDYGAGTSLEIVREGAGPLLVPFTRAAVPVVDVAGRRVVVVPPEEVEARERPAKAAVTADGRVDAVAGEGDQGDEAGRNRAQGDAGEGAVAQGAGAQADGGPGHGETHGVPA